MTDMVTTISVATEPLGAPKRTRKGRVTEDGIRQRCETLRKQGWLLIPPRTPLLMRVWLAARRMP